MATSYSSGPGSRPAPGTVAQESSPEALASLLRRHGAADDLPALDRIGVELSPEVLSEKAREVIAKLGYDQRPADSASGFYYNTSVTDYVEKNDKPRPRWDDHGSS